MRLISILIILFTSCSSYDYSERVSKNVIDEEQRSQLIKYKKENKIKDRNNYVYYEQEVVDSSLPSFVLPN